MKNVRTADFRAPKNASTMSSFMQANHLVQRSLTLRSLCGTLQNSSLLRLSIIRDTLEILSELAPSLRAFRLSKR